MPVYNGENFIKQALDSVLAQTFENFELIISDNASKDKTEEICRQYAAQDKRIRYYQNENNLGAAPNYNRVFELSSGKYFKWIAHDDVCEPELLQRCIELFERDETVVLCYSSVKIIDAQGQEIDKNNNLYSWVSSGTAQLNLDSLKPHERFRSVISPHPCYQVFGLIRSRALKMTSLIGSYSGSDRILLAQLALQGKFHEFPDQLLYQRRHVEQSIQSLGTHRSAHKYTNWFDAATEGKIIFPRWQASSNLLASIAQAPLNRKEKIKCFLATINWFRRTRKGMIKDLSIAMQQILTRLHHK
ncbi:MAG: glycosyltransferase [Cyanobacteria bacterium]|nr:glycosyltransferase [Cyanobacteria bacterium GSL.Bin21]